MRYLVMELYDDGNILWIVVSAAGSRWFRGSELRRSGSKKSNHFEVNKKDCLIKDLKI